jgi:hypothetical protein
MTEADDTPFKYTLVGPGIAIERNLGETVAFATLQVALGTAPSVPVLSPSGPAVQPNANGRKLSLREFMLESGAKTYPSKIVVTGRYLRDHESRADFSRDEIRDRFRSAGEPPASNLPRDFTAAVGAGWIAEDHENRGRYYVTRKGDEAADRQFEGGAPSTKARRKRRPASPDDGSSPDVPDAREES